MAVDDIKKRTGEPKDFGKLVLELIWLSVITLPLILWAIIQKFKTPHRKSLRGEVVLITGAGNGLGREVAIEMAEKGCRLALVDINEEWVNNVTQEINKKHKDVAKSYVANLGQPVAIKKISEQIIADFGRVDLLINNAGIIYGGISLLEFKDQELDAVFQVNVMSQFRMIREFLGGMLERNHGHIVSISSCSSYVGLANASVYTSTKWALNGMMETLREELRAIPDNQVKISICCPYFISTSPLYTEQWDLRIPPLSVSEAAVAVIDGIEKEEDQFSIPPHMYMLLNLIKLFPNNLKDVITSIFYTRVLPTTESVRKASPIAKQLEIDHGK